MVVLIGSHMVVLIGSHDGCLYQTVQAEHTVNFCSWVGSQVNPRTSVAQVRTNLYVFPICDSHSREGRGINPYQSTTSYCIWSETFLHVQLKGILLKLSVKEIAFAPAVQPRAMHYKSSSKFVARYISCTPLYVTWGQTLILKLVFRPTVSNLKTTPQASLQGQSPPPGSLYSPCIVWSQGSQPTLLLLPSTSADIVARPISPPPSRCLRWCCHRKNYYSPLDCSLIRTPNISIATRSQLIWIPQYSLANFSKMTVIFRIQ